MDLISNGNAHLPFLSLWNITSFISFDIGKIMIIILRKGSDKAHSSRVRMKKEWERIYNLKKYFLVEDRENTCNYSHRVKSDESDT